MVVETLTCYLVEFSQDRLSSTISDETRERIKLRSGD